MESLKVREIVNAVSGRLLCGNEDTVITDIQYDSRTVGEGSLFVPLVGEKVDAHKFIPACMEKCAATLTMNDAPEGAEKPYIKVDDTLAALQALAAFYRSRFKGLRLVGVTGSVGKTSTKEMIAAALSGGFCVMKTSGNKNSQIGMPSTMFDISPEHEAAVIEMGMSQFGEMEKLCEIARPTMAVMTNIGVAHIENLKTQENIMSEKLKITGHFDSSGVLFLNGDDKLLRTLYGKQPFRTVSFGLSSDNDYYAAEIAGEGYNTTFTCCSGDSRERYTIPALGAHSVMNALAAIAVCKAMGMESIDIAKGLMTYKNAPMRQQIKEAGGFTIIDDSYNSSPDAAVVSIDVLSSFAGKGKTIAVLADMLELGDVSEREHYKVGAHAGKKGIDALVAVGELSKHTAEGAAASGCSEVYSFGTNEEAAAKLRGLISPGCTVLVKGSRGMHTDEIVRIISEFSV